jgi:putative ABC transport system permease protein
MRTPIAWLNTTQNKKRTATAVGGICFAVLLIFMQAGFLGAARMNASLAYSILDFDLILISRGYLTMPRSETIDRYRIIQASSVPGVASAQGLLVEGADWRNAATSDTSSCFVFGIAPRGNPFLDSHLNTQGARLEESLTALVDRNSRRSYGAWEVGGRGTVNGQSLRITGSYALGMGLLADGSIIVSENTYARLYGMASVDRFNFGLIKLAPGETAAEVAQRLRAALPDDVVIATKPEIMHREERYFVTVKPVGIMFQVGMAVAFIVGAVILYQILSSEISNRLREFATMKAMGYTARYIYNVGIVQGLLFSLMGYFPSLAISLGLYRLLRELSGFPVYMDFNRAAFVFSLSLGMCAIAAALALGKIKRADPADLF